MRYSKRNCILRVGRGKKRDDVYKSSDIVYYLKCYNESCAMVFSVISYGINNMDIDEIIILRTIYCTDMRIFIIMYCLYYYYPYTDLLSAL